MFENFFKLLKCSETYRKVFQLDQKPRKIMVFSSDEDEDEEETDLPEPAKVINKILVSHDLSPFSLIVFQNDRFCTILTHSIYYKSK